MQNYSSHRKLAPKTYYISGLLALIVLILSIVFSCCICTAASGLLLPVALGLLSIALIFIAYFARAFALKAQDRAIRAEEQLRHFVLTGKLMDARLNIRQIIALRFAADQEFVELAQKAAEEKWSADQIKKSIQHWRADEYRV